MRVARKRAAKRTTSSGTDPELASTILRTVSLPEAFMFFTDLGQYTGELAPCLTDFCEKLKTVPLKSVEFHFERGDFERWIRETLGDEYLASRITDIDRSTHGEKLRTTIEGIVRRRVDQLKAAARTGV